MKQTLFCLLFFTSFFCSCAQSNSKDTLREYQFSDSQKKDWDSLQAAWMNKTFFPLLKKNKIKISCASCDGAYLEVFFEIHEDGHCHPKILGSRKCETQFSPAQLKQLDRSLMLLGFPPSFYNTKIQIRLGRVLKC